jgi:hypothetical protein
MPDNEGASDSNTKNESANKNPDYKQNAEIEN